VRNAGFEPTTFGSGGEFGALVADGCVLQALANQTVWGDGRLQVLQADPHVCTDFVPGLSPSECTHGSGAGPGRGASFDVEERLWSVREVAASLGVSTATVYKLVARGEIPSLRVSNAVRFRAGAVRSYLAGSGPGAHPSDGVEAVRG